MIPFIAAGMGISAFASIKEGEQANAAGMWQEKVANAEAKATEQAGQYESREIRKNAERAQAAMIASTYATGGIMSGSKLIGLADQAREYEADARVTMNNYQLKATGLRQQGAMARIQGKQARTAGYLRAAGSAAQGIGSMYLLGAGGGKLPFGANSLEGVASQANDWVSGVGFP